MPMKESPIRVLRVPFRKFKQRICEPDKPKKVRPFDLSIERAVPDIGPEGTFVQARESVHLWKLEYGNSYMCSYMKRTPGNPAPVQVPLKLVFTTDDMSPEAILGCISTALTTNHTPHICTCTTPCATCKCIGAKE
jgi:hypothetical protein